MCEKNDPILVPYRLSVATVVLEPIEQWENVFIPEYTAKPSYIDWENKVFSKLVPFWVKQAEGDTYQVLVLTRDASFNEVEKALIPYLE